MATNKMEINQTLRWARLGAAAIWLALLTAVVFLVTIMSKPNSGVAQTVEQRAPVTTLKLTKQAFTREARLTGSVGLYREEDIGFEVGGRVLFVLDLGNEVIGQAFDENGTRVRQGDVIAKIDDTRYRLRVDALAAKVGALEKDLKAQRIDVNQVAQANLRAAHARLKTADSEVIVAQRQVAEAVSDVTRTQLDLRRQIDLKRARSTAFRQKTFDDAQAAYDAAVARKDQREALLASRRSARDTQEAAVTVAEATIRFKEAALEATQGRITELEQELNQAKEDLGDTILHAPFSGRITKIHASQGAVIEGGRPVVTLTLMDPIQVRVEVSADTERRLRTGDRALVFPKDPTDPDREPIQVNALVFEKGAVANPDTRTFRIDLIVRNRRRLVQDVDPETKGLPVVMDFLPVARRFEGESGPLFVPAQSIYHEDGKTYVLRLPGISFHDGAQRNAVGRHVPEKIEVKLANDYFTVIKWSFRSLAQSGDLREGDFLVIGPGKEHLQGLAIDRPQWLLRPGDLVPVQFNLETTPKGFYVPVHAIANIGGRNIVYLAKDGKAVPVPIIVHDTFGELRRVAGDGLENGAVLIVDGIQQISAGQPVSIVDELSNLQTGGDRP